MPVISGLVGAEKWVRQLLFDPSHCILVTLSHAKCLHFSLSLGLNSRAYFMYILNDILPLTDCPFPCFVFSHFLGI